MLDKEGYRPNVGIILANPRNEVFWGKRVHQHAWQFPQGGIKHGETPLQALYRGLAERIWLQREHVRILGRKRGAARRGATVRDPRGGDFQPLPLRERGANAGSRRPIQPQSARVSAESPAAQVMTDLTRVAPATIRPQAPLAGANQFMITRGVRLLLVTDDHENVLSVITATDILSDRPMRAAIDRGMRRDELTVGAVMTGADQVQGIAYPHLDAALSRPLLDTLPP